LFLSNLMATTEEEEGPVDEESEDSCCVDPKASAV
jgi:hypothetical protein